MKRFISLILLLFLISINSYSYSCTIFEASNSEKTLVGNNEDWIGLDRNDSMVWFLPATKDKYGRMFFGWKSAGPEGGMNDQGLFFDWVAKTPRTLLPRDPDKKDYNGNECDLLLEKCANVNEAIEVLKTYNFPSLGYAEIMVVDESGNSAVVTWDWNKNELIIVRSNKGYQVIGYGYDIVKELLEIDGDKPSIEKFRLMLGASMQGDYTVYSNIYDLKNKDVYLYFSHDFYKAVKFSLNEELKKGSHLYNLYSLFPNGHNGIKLNNLVFKDLMLLEIVALLVFGLSFIATIIICLNQFIKSIRKSSQEKELKINVLINTIAGLNGFICLAALYLVVRYAGFIYKYGFGFFGGIIKFIPVMVITISVIQLISILALWKSKFLTVARRLIYSISTLVFIFFIICLNIWGLFKM